MKLLNLLKQLAIIHTNKCTGVNLLKQLAITHKCEANEEKKENKQEEQDEKLTATLYQSKVKWLSKHKSVSFRTFDAYSMCNFPPLQFTYILQ